MKMLFLTFAFGMAASAAEWTGYISDSSCGKANANDSQASKECAQRCVKNGSDPVFVVGDQVLSIADKSKVSGFVGDKVKVTGTLNGSTVTIATIKKAS
jgi:hypothetical protein